MSVGRPKVEDPRCKRLFGLEPYYIRYKEVGIEHYSLKQVYCKDCCILEKMIGGIPMKLFYTEKEMQKEIERRMGEFERDRWNNERFERLERRICEMENVVDRLATRLNRHVDESGDMCKGVTICQP